MEPKEINKDEFFRTFQPLPDCVYNNEVKEGNKICGYDRYKVLIVGSGFSGRYDEDLMYTTLLCKLEDKIKPGNQYYNNLLLVKSLSKTFNEDNFELLMRNIDITKKTLSTLSQLKTLSEEFNFEDTYLQIKDLFAYAVLILSNRSKVQSKLKHISKFILGFDMIFTLNYDPQMYWALMESSPYEQSPKQLKLRCFGDYFSNADNIDLCEFTPYARQFIYGKENRDMVLVHYLHGSVFLITDSNGTVKKVRAFDSPIDSIPLIDRARQVVNSKEDYRHLIISEGQSKHKMQLISEIPYLNHCYNQLCNLPNRNDIDICIIGFSGSEQYDKHIIDAILKNENANLYIGVYNKQKENIIYKGKKEYSYIYSHLKKTQALSFYDVTETGALPSD